MFSKQKLLRSAKKGAASFKMHTLIIMLMALVHPFQVSADDYSGTITSDTDITITTDGDGININGTAYDGLGNISVKSGASLIITFNTTKPVICNGYLRVVDGQLKLLLGSDYNSNYTMMRGSSNTDYYLLDMYAASGVSVSDCKLLVIGNENKKFHIHGGANFTVTGSNESGWEAIPGADCIKATRSIVILRGGTASFSNVTFSNNWTESDSPAAGAISVTKNYTYCDISMTGCKIDNCYTNTSGAAIYFTGKTLTPDVTSKMTLTSCEIQNCFTQGGDPYGGTIRNAGSTTCDMILNSCKFTNNKSLNSGGAFYWNSLTSELVASNCEFKNNYANGTGGAIRNISVTQLHNCTFDSNYATKSGGAIYFTMYGVADLTEEQVRPQDASLTLDEGTSFINNTSCTAGGALCINVKPITKEGDDPFTVYYNNEGERYSVSVHFNGATMKGNQAQNGGAIAIFRTTEIYNSDLNFNYGQLIENKASNLGGAVYVSTANTATIYGDPPFGLVNMSINIGKENGTNPMIIKGNTAVSDGGGIYIKHNSGLIPTISIYNCQIGGEGQGDGNMAEGNGGAICVVKGSAKLMGGVISNNSAKNKGGAIYVNGDNLEINGGSLQSNTADYGGGVYAKGGTLTINGGDIAANTAYDGAGFYVDGGKLYLYGGTIGQTGNHATHNGGGFYINGGETHIEKAEGSSASAIVKCNMADGDGGGFYMKGTSTNDKAVAYFKDGTIKDNIAGYNKESGNGGGIYLANYAELYMSGASAITGNHVPANGHGGGVFKQGGVNSLLWVSGSSLQIVNNYAGESTKRSNAYLNAYEDYITVDKDNGIDANGTIKIGVSVNVTSPDQMPTPVIHCETVSYMNDIFNMLKENNGSGIFDDAAKYVAVYQPHPEPFNSREIFFISTWASVAEEIEHFNATEISTPKELAWFMVLVNGLNGHTADPDLEGAVIADIDMSEYYWNPIGEYDHNDPNYNLDPTDPHYKPTPIYTGNFEGGGHTISGLKTCGIIGYYNYGLFGHTGSDAQIKNVVLADCDFVSGETSRMGSLIAEMNGGVAENCIVSGKLNPSGSETKNNDEHYCVVGGLIGEAKGTATIRNCIATEEINATPIEGEIYSGMQAFTVGGLVGMTSAGTFIENCFANPEIHHGGKAGNGTTLKDYSRYVGGLIGENHGTVKNCYVRLERGSVLSGATADANVPGKVSKFGMFAGLNDGTIDHCFYPNNSLRHANITAYNADLYYSGHEEGESEGHGQYNAVVRPYTYTTYLVDNQVSLDGGSGYGTDEETTLLGCLNDWVDDQTGTSYSHWMRTEGSDVNADYPVLSYDNLISTLNYTTVGSKDGINLEYANRFNEIYGRFAAETEKEGCLFIYRTPWTGIISSPASEIITADNSASGNNISIYVEEDVALMQDGTAPTLKNVYTCQVLKGKAWHTVASSLTGSKTGFIYGMTDQVQWNENTNPCSVTLGGSANSIFPTGTPVDGIDLYCFYEPQYHWVNLKRNQQSHWHMNAHNVAINYSKTLNCGYDEKYFYDNQNTNSTLVPGKGYLAAINKDMILQGDGMLTNGEVKVPVSVKAGDYNTTAMGTEGTELKGYNLLGNPYQSYLSFSAFANGNSGLWNGTATYAVYDGKSGMYVPGSVVISSTGSLAASGNINMHQGFFIVADNAGTATFTNAMRSDKPEGGTHFRSESPAYPLVNLMVTDGNGVGDVAVVEFDRPEYQSAAKMKHIGADGKIYFHYNDEDHALLFLNEDTDRLPVHFDAIENGTYTMTWSTANATFSYLHLIDNMTGIDVDMLSSDAYTFTASSSDYKSRFKLMFAYTGVEENASASTSSASFAFMHDGALTVNGEGMLEVIDMSGRTIVISRLTDAQNTVSLPQAAQGVYVLRLTNDNQSKVQKIVIE